MTGIEVACGASPGDSRVKNLPANAGDKGSIPDPGKSLTALSNSARVPQLLKPPSPRARPLQQERPP